MNEGETKTIALEPTEAFGPQVELEVGSRVSINSPEGKKFTGTILKVKEEKISVDFNHLLAGKSLIFTVTVVSIV